MSDLVNFPMFFLIWAEFQGWAVPDFHLIVCEFLAKKSRKRLLMIPRGHAKSTILAVYNAWRFYCNPQYRILHQGDQDTTARKCSRDTRSVLEKHPLTRHLICSEKIKKSGIVGEVDFWWMPGALDERNPSMQAAGILSNITSSRADETQNDDVEVPKNIGTEDARAKMRQRLTEQTHILVPGGTKTFVGTPHTYYSLYTELQEDGADCLIMRMFKHEHRLELQKAEDGRPTDTRHAKTPFRPEFVFINIGKGARALIEGKDYEVSAVNDVWHTKIYEKHNLVDLYAGALWPERFTLEEMEVRRKDCKTLNEWDSQYQLHAKPLGNVRLNPDYLLAYDCEPEIRIANKTKTMWLGNTQIASATLRWDPSSGKLKSDASSIALVLQDIQGRIYWHRTGSLTGQIAEFDDHGKVIGGQVWQLCDIVEKFQLTRIVIETNGVGTHNPAIMQGALKARRLRCGVTEHNATENKNKRILSAIESPLVSGYLWAHISVLDETNPETGETGDSEAVKQMRNWNPTTQSQADDHLDALSGAITDEPIRVGKSPTKSNPLAVQSWRTNSGQYEAELDFN